MDHRKHQQIPETTSHSDLYRLSEQIDAASQRVQDLSNQLDKLGRDAAERSAVYDKELAVTLIRLKNGDELEFFGQTIKNPPASTSERIAKGICYKAKLEAELADHLYMDCQQKLKAAMAVLSGRQSKNRYLDCDIS
jgi:hypothetical protein